MQGHVIGQQAVRISWSKNPGQVKTFAVTLTDVMKGLLILAGSLNVVDDLWYLLKDGWVTQADPSQWSGYYGYGQGYDAYGYGTTQDPSLYAYGGYGYPQYPQQVKN